MNIKLTDIEVKSFKKFQKKHRKICNKNTNFSYIITPTGIGTGINIRCNKCMKEKDITDYGSW